MEEALNRKISSKYVHIKYKTFTLSDFHSDDFNTTSPQIRPKSTQMIPTI